MPGISNATFIGTSAQVAPRSLLGSDIALDTILDENVKSNAAIAKSKLSGVAGSGANTDITSLGGITTPLSVAQGGQGKATLGAHKVIVGNDAGAVTEISPDTAGKVLVSNGINLDPSFQTVGNYIPAWELISTVTMTNVAFGNSVEVKVAEFTGLTGDSQDEYMLIWEGILATYNNTETWGITLNDDKTAAHYEYLGIVMNGGATTVTGLNGSGIKFDVGRGTNFPNGSGIVTIKASKTIAGTARYIDSNTAAGLASTGSLRLSKLIGWWVDTTNELTSIQFYMYSTGASPTISGKISLYKIHRA